VTDSERVKHDVAAPLSDRIEALRDLVPEAFAEDGIDFDELRAVLGDDLDDRPERYSFSWAGKREAIQLLQLPSRATLKPARDESVEFDATQHVFIDGENLETLKLLRKAYGGQVKMIYIDPPYNTGNDFIYPDDFSDPLGRYLQLTGQTDDAGNLLTSNPETSGRYHSAWLSMMYPRLFLARQLLREDGVIFVSIDDHEVHNLRLLMNEIFGEENFVESFVWKKSYGGGAKEKYAVTQHEYILMYARQLNALHELWLPPDPETEKKYYKFRDQKFPERGPYRLKPLEATKSMDRRENLVFPVPLPWGGEVSPKRQWWWSRERVEKALNDDELHFLRKGDDVTVSYKQYLRDPDGEIRGSKPFSIIDRFYTQTGTRDLTRHFDGAMVAQFPKPVGLMEYLVALGTPEGKSELIIDFFAGASTTGEAVLALNKKDSGSRRALLVQLPELLKESDPAFQRGCRTIADIGKERMRSVIADLTSDAENLLTETDSVDFGLRVFRLQPSDFRQWEPVDPEKPDELIDQMDLFVDPLVDGWKSEDVLWEVAIKEGYALHSRVEPLDDIAQNTVWRVTDPDKGQSFLICLDTDVQEATVAALRLSADDLFICRDVALTDTLAANLALQCRLKTI
jgi:adenine-specific DNA-methyltransferase